MLRSKIKQHLKYELETILVINSDILRYIFGYSVRFSLMVTNGLILVEHQTFVDFIRVSL
jgi:hypothetical protein